MRVSNVLLFSFDQQYKNQVYDHFSETLITHVETVEECYYQSFRREKIPFSTIIVASNELTLSLKNLMECLELHSKSRSLYFVSHTRALFEAIPQTWIFAENLQQVSQEVSNAITKNHARKTKDRAAACNNSDKFIQDLQNEYEVLLDGAGEGIIGLDGNGIITFANKTASELLGTPREKLLNQAFTNYSIDSPLKIGANTSSFIVSNSDRRRVGRGAINRPDGSQIYVEFTQSFVGNMESNTVSIMVIEDVSERIKFESKLMKLAYSDNLTGLHNRYYFEKTLGNELRNRRSQNHSLILALIDLDGFKEINDTYGHMVGDKLLVLVGKRISECVRRSDLIARLGGDEFCLLFKDLELSSAKLLLEKILFQLKQPFQIGDHTIKISGSIGFVESKSESDDFRSLICEADKAMYSVKNTGRNGVADAKISPPVGIPSSPPQSD